MPDDLNSTLPPLHAAPPPDRSWQMWCHLSALAGLVVPFGNLLGPLIVWQVKKHEIPEVDAHGKAAVNFQLTITLAVVVGFIAAFLLSFVCIGYLLFPVVGAIGICGLVFAVIAGIKANDGQEYRYPYSLELIK